MSHCANYLLRVGGTLYQGNTRWGSKSLVRELLWGPDEVLPFLQELVGAPPFEQEPPQTAGWIYNEVMTEGAVFADYDAKRLLAFGGEDIRSERALQVAYESILRAAWPGWVVDYASGWAEVANEARVPVQPFDDKPRGLTALGLVSLSSDPVTALNHSGPWFTLVTLMDSTRTRHYHVNAWGAAVLDTPREVIFENLDAIDGQPLVERSCLAQCGVLFDRKLKRLRYWMSEVPARLQAQLEAAWPTWRVMRVEGSAVAQVRFGGDEIAQTPSMTVLREVVASELERGSAGLAAIIAEIRHRLGEPGTRGATGVTEVPKEIEGDRTERLARIIASFPVDERMR